MAFDIAALLRLWSEPLPESDEEAEALFRTVYADPVTINGTATSARDLVTRARAVQGVFAQPPHEILEIVEDGSKVAVAFRMRGRQVGPLPTVLGTLEPTDGAELDLRVIDVLTLVDGRISTIWMVADELGALVSRGAVTWSGTG
jgi:hypothetical protein